MGSWCWGHAAGTLQSLWDISWDAAVVRNRRQHLENETINKSLPRPHHLKLLIFFIWFLWEWQEACTKRSSASNVTFLSWNTTAVEKENNKIWKPFIEQMHIHIPLALYPQTTSLLQQQVSPKQMLGLQIFGLPKIHKQIFINTWKDSRQHCSPHL